jgi:glutamine amidotransferase
MCRLYGFRSNQPTIVECTLVHAQNALLKQSRRDSTGVSHNHGWGLAAYQDDSPVIERQAWAAYHGEQFRDSAAQIRSKTVLAHVRHATVGGAELRNTHPFRHGSWSLVHNGTVPAFDRLCDRFRESMPAAHRDAIEGETDSEHLFHLLLGMIEASPDRPLLEVLRSGLREVLDWCREVDPDAPIGLNVILTEGRRIVGSRLGRTLHFVERDGVRDCEVCGMPHAQSAAGDGYRAVVLASEAISHEDWRPVPEGSVYTVTPDLRLHVEPLAA